MRSSCRGKYGLRKAVNQVNSARENTRNGHNSGFLGMARPGSDGPGLPFGGENDGAAGSASPFVSSGQALG